MKPIGYKDGELLRGKWTDYHYTLYMDSIGQQPSTQWVISNWVTVKETIRRDIRQ